MIHSSIWRGAVCLVTALLFVSCGAVPAQTRTATSTPTRPAHPAGSGALLPTPTPTLPPSVLRGLTTFLLETPLHFSDVSGTSTDGGGNETQLDAKIIESGINDEFKYLLFMVDEAEHVQVAIPGSSTPLAAQVTRQSDGSATIDYTQSSNSEAGSFTLTFEGSLWNDQMLAIYEQQYSPLIISNVPASDVKVAFSAQVRRISSSEIPAAPTNGTYHSTSNGGITLSWSAGQNAAQYNVYRLIPNQDQQFQLLGTVTGTSYTDTTPAAIQSAQRAPGVAYAIFSVGASGVENPVNLTITVAPS